MMKLYKEEGVNPLGGCLPMLLQTPFLIMLYGVIKGLANKVLVHGKLVSLPRYIPPVPRCTTISCGPVVRSSPSAWTST